MNQIIVGVDCATEDARIGLAFAECRNGRTTINESTICARERSAADTVASWLRKIDAPALIAIDAPLGWPVDLGRQLAAHHAGQTIPIDPNLMFRRATDRYIQATLGKTPLDVGADRIARTAHAALRLLGDLRTSLGASIPMAWESGFAGLSAIEVYPAATLVAHGLRSTGYKKSSQVNERREIISPLSRWIDCRSCVHALESNADVLDAAICVLAATDFLEGNAVGPTDAETAKQEGWIWARRRKA